MLRFYILKLFINNITYPIKIKTKSEKMIVKYVKNLTSKFDIASSSYCEVVVDVASPART